MRGGFRKRMPPSASSPSADSTGPNAAAQTVSYVSTGVASFDTLLGSGLRTGAVNIVFEDRFTDYAALLLRIAAARGVASGDVLCVVGRSKDAALGFVESLPSWTTTENKDGPADDDGDDFEVPATSATVRSFGSLRDRDRLSVAWRYQHMPKLNASINSTSKSSLAYTFDITKQISKETLNSAKVALIDISEWAVTENSSASTVYQKILAAISTIIVDGKFRAAQTGDSSEPALRIILTGVASPVWGNDSGSISAIQALFRFITQLKIVIRGAKVVVLASIPAYLYQNHQVGVSVSPMLKCIMHAADNVFEFERSKRLFSTQFSANYHGFLHVHKLSASHALVSPILRTLSNSDLHSLAFQIRRKRFLIEPFRLPPEEENTKDENSGLTDTGIKALKSVKIGSCTSSGNSVMDF
ncbi:Elongator subunit elp4 [Entophlyctis sp. JEL0112]|nr:Elongator subunit elp4 [Entophlyctis sp. JEL0112]